MFDWSQSSAEDTRVAARPIGLLLVATHYHEDHYGGIDDLAEAPAVPIINGYDRGDKAFLPSSRLDSRAYRDYDAAIENRAEHLTRGETISLDPATTVVCISAGGLVFGEPDPPQHGADENDMSISLLVEFGASGISLVATSRRPWKRRSWRATWAWTSTSTRPITMGLATVPAKCCWMARAQR
jgi:hypothetical protein